MFHLIQPFVVHESVQEVLRLTLLQFLARHRVDTVQNVGGGRRAALRGHDQVHLSQNSAH